MPIEQVYCTHCTYGTSALEQREGELADRVLGYSARAGSLDRNELRNDYRAIERFLYYYLPSDTPPEDKQRLDAAAAPRRLFFCPAMGKLQMVGQVAYRQYDTAGRLGSYFAHVLFGEHTQGNWSVADCLRLWQAPWVEEDSAEHSYKLPPLERLDDLWRGKTPLVSDDAVLDFLQTLSPSFSDGLGRPPHERIDARWQSVPAQQRIDLLVNTLQGLLNLGQQRRENILLVVEPGIAALVFYAVARLLPKSLSAGLSFSTYEPNAERLPVTLAATTFFDPFTNDVRSDLYRRRGLVINTYQDRISEAGPPQGDYARFIVDRLLEDGWPMVDRLLAAFDEAGARRAEDVELLARTHRVSTQVLSDLPPADDGWRKSEVAVRYLQRELQHQLANAPAGWPQLHKVLGTPNHLTVLELVAGDGMPAELRMPAQFLLKKFPPERIADLINSPLVTSAAKLEALLAFVTAQNRLPEGCQLLPTDGGRLKPRPASEALLGELLLRLPEPVLRRLGDAIADEQRMAWFGVLVDACGGRQAPPLKKAVVEMIAQFTDAELLDALSRYREPIRRACPPPERVLAKRLGRLLYELPKHPKSFEPWLAALLEWKGSFAHPHLAEQRLGEWNKIHHCLLALRETGEAASIKRGIKNRLRSPPRAEYKPLAEALNRAMPRRPDEFQELHDVAARCLLNPPQFKQRLELAARHAGLSITFGDETSELAAADDDLFSAPGDEVGRLHQRREQQARLLALFHDLEERLLIYPDDGLGSEKLRVLQQLGQAIVGRPDFLGPGRPMVEAYFSNGGAWSGPVLLSGGSKKTGHKNRKKRGKPRWQPSTMQLMYGGVAAGVALVVVMIGYFLPRGPRLSEVAAKPSATQPLPPKTASATTASDASKTARPTQAPKPPADTPATSTKSPELAAPEHAPSPESDTGQLSKPKARVADPDTDEAMPTPVANASSKPAPTEATRPTGSTSPAMPSAAAPDTKAPVSNPVSPPKLADGKPAATTTPEPTPKPDDPQPPPNQSAPTSDAPKKDAPIIVSDYCTLPVPGRAFASPMSLKKWTDDPGPITLTLHGLTSANKHLNGRSSLSTKKDGEQFSVVLEDTAGDGASHSLARFTINGNELSFQWVESAQSFSAARLHLRRCVVEVAGDSETSFISLMTPLKRSELGLKIGTARLDLQELHNLEFQFSADDDLRLGRGSVQFGDMPPLAFGEKRAVDTTASMHGLPSPVHDSHAVVVLAQNEKNPLDADLHMASDTTVLPEGVSPVSQEDRKALKTLRDNIPKLRNLVGTLNRLNQKQSANMESRIQTLAELLNIANPPSRAGKAPPPEATAFAAAVKKQIIEPAEERRDKLSRRVDAFDKFLEAQQAQLKVLVTRAVTITATIYRRVDVGLFAPCLELGDVTKIPEELAPGFGYDFKADNEE